MSAPHSVDTAARAVATPGRAAVAVVAVAVVAVFARALGGGFVYDDLTLLATNPGLHDPTDLGALWTTPLWGQQLGHWRPLTAQLLAFGWWLGDGRPWAIHLLALLLHVAAAIAMLRLGTALGRGRGAALLAALLFALHPAQAESVGWCSALNDVLAGTLGLWGLVAWHRGRRTGERGTLLLALVLAALAMAAKEAGALVPMLYVGVDAIDRATPAPGRGPRWWPRLAALALLPGFWLLRAAVFGDLAAGLDRSTFALPGSTAGLGAAVAAGLGTHLLWPFGLGMFAPVGAVGAAAFAALGVLLLATAAAAWRGDGAARVGALLLLAGILLPAVAVRGLGPYPIADRYLYLACAGLGLALATWPPLCRLLPAVVLLFAATTIGRLDTWSEPERFVDRAVAQAPDDPRVQYMRGQLLLDRAMADPAPLPAATAALQRARALLGGDLGRVDHLQRLRADVAIGLAWCRLLTAALRPRPDWQPVEAAFLELAQRWPDRSEPWVGLGVLRGASGRQVAAEQAFRRAIELDPGTVAAHFNLALLCRQRGDLSAARAELHEVLRLQPDHAGARRELADLTDIGSPR